MYQLPQTGAVYNRYKKMVQVNIIKASLNTYSWEWIKEFEATEDSKSAYQFLVENARDTMQLTSGYCFATRVFSLSPNCRGVLYRNEFPLSFNKYSTKMQEAYSTLTCYHNVVPDQFHV